MLPMPAVRQTAAAASWWWRACPGPRAHGSSSVSDPRINLTLWSPTLALCHARAATSHRGLRELTAHNRLKRVAHYRRVMSLTPAAAVDTQVARVTRTNAPPAYDRLCAGARHRLRWDAVPVLQ